MDFGGSDGIEAEAEVRRVNGEPETETELMAVDSQDKLAEETSGESLPSLRNGVIGNAGDEKEFTIRVDGTPVTLQDSRAPAFRTR